MLNFPTMGTLESKELLLKLAAGTTGGSQLNLLKAFGRCLA